MDQSTFKDSNYLEQGARSMWIGSGLSVARPLESDEVNLSMNEGSNRWVIATYMK